MATISENLQTIKDSTDAIKQAIIDKGGTISGDITTWADAILALGGGSSKIEFTISSATYEADEGMTWGEWVDSEYNPGMFGYGSSEPAGTPIQHVVRLTPVTNNLGMGVYSTDVIIEGGTYSC